MKEVYLREGDKITGKIVSPWLSEAEAASHLGISKSSFRRELSSAPFHRITPKCKRYDCRELDAYLQERRSGAEALTTQQLLEPTRSGFIPQPSRRTPKIKRPANMTRARGEQ